MARISETIIQTLEYDSYYMNSELREFISRTRVHHGLEGNRPEFEQGRSIPSTVDLCYGFLEETGCDPWLCNFKIK